MDFCILVGSGVGLLYIVAARAEREAGRKDISMLMGMSGVLMLIATAVEFFTKG